MNIFRGVHLLCIIRHNVKGSQFTNSCHLMLHSGMFHVSKMCLLCSILISFYTVRHVNTQIKYVFARLFAKCIASQLSLKSSF